MKLFLIIGKFFWKLFYSSKRFRRILFDSHSTDNKFLLSVQNENYVVSTRDKVIGRDIYVNGQFDFEKLEKALKLLGNKFSAKVLIDIGANIGTICIPSIKRKIFSTAIAFEPDPTNFTLLNANILLNHINDSIDTFNYAITNKDKINLRLAKSDNNLGDHRILMSKEVNENLINVYGYTLDSQIKYIDPKKTLIWIDTQGHEGYILDGAKKILSMKVPIVLEFFPQAMQNSQSFELLKNALQNSPYTKFYNLDDGVCESSLINKTNLDDLYKKIGLNGNFVDLLIL